ncbi:MAG: response regulator [Sneathiellaceae bacterium]
MAYRFDRISLLVVEDNPNMRRLVGAVLNAIGVTQIHWAHSVPAALEVLKDVPVDIVLTDYNMEPVDGLAFTRMLRDPAQNPSPFIPIILMTGHATKKVVAAARGVGVTEFLAKPVSVASMYDRLVEVIENPRPFVRTGSFFGPDRRRQVKSFEVERRGAGAEADAGEVEL